MELCFLMQKASMLISFSFCFSFPLLSTVQRDLSAYIRCEINPTGKPQLQQKLRVITPREADWGYFVKNWKFLNLCLWITVKTSILWLDGDECHFSGLCCFPLLKSTNYRPRRPLCWLGFSQMGSWRGLSRTLQSLISSTVGQPTGSLGSTGLGCRYAFVTLFLHLQAACFWDLSVF